MLDKYGSVACLNEKIGKEEISVESKKKIIKNVKRPNKVTASHHSRWIFSNRPRTAKIGKGKTNFRWILISKNVKRPNMAILHTRPVFLRRIRKSLIWSRKFCKSYICSKPITRICFCICRRIRTCFRICFCGFQQPGTTIWIVILSSSTASH